MTNAPDPPPPSSGLDEHCAAQVAELFRALGDTSRVRILALLAAGEASVHHLAQAVAEGRLSFLELTQHYASLVYAAEGRYDQAAKRLGMDWRALRQKVDPELVKFFGILPRLPPSSLRVTD